MSPASLLLLLLAPAVALCVNLYATDYSGTVSLLSLTTSGSKSSISLVSSTKACGTQPSWLTINYSARILYCLDDSNSGGSLYAYSIGSNGAITQTAKTSVLGNAVHSSLYGGSAGTSYISIAHYQTSSVSTFALPLTSSSTALQTFKYTMAAKGPNASRQDAPHPHQTLLDPTGKFIIVPDLGADLIRIFSVNTATGSLTSCPTIAAPAGSGPRHAAFWTPGSGTSGTMLYLASELANTVSAYKVTYPSGSGTCLTLSLTQTGSPYPAGHAALGAGVVAGEVRVNGNYVVSSNRADNSFGTNLDSLATFSLSSTGALTFQKISSTYGSYPRSFSINKAGTFVAVGNQYSATVAIINRDPATGAMGTLVGTVSVGAVVTGGTAGLSSVIWDE